VAIATLFGVVVFVSKAVVPSPLDKMFVVVQALLLALGALLLGRLGATYVAAVGGVLTALWRIALAPFSLGLAILYGLFVDGFFLALKVKTSDGKVQTGRLVAVMTMSTALIGLFSYYLSYSFGLVPRNVVLEVVILVVGTLSGAFGGYFALVFWERHLKNVEL
jgi:hypothetical protein